MGGIYLGIDLGTSAMKMVLIDEKKHVLSQITEEYQLSHPKEGWNEVNQLLWYESMKKGMKEILSDVDRTLLKGIGVTGQMHTLIVLGENGEFIRPALMWNDIRTKDIIPQLKETLLGFEEGEYLSRTVSTGSPAANLYWLKLNEPENYKKIKKFLIGPDYLVYCLTNNYGTDYCEASTSCLFEIDGKRWSPQMREFLELEESVYPEVKGSGQIAGMLNKELSDMLGIDHEVFVLVGTGDNPSTAISTGCLGKGYPVISLGTSGVFMMPVKDFGKGAKGKRILFSFDDQEYFNLIQGAVQSNGSTFEWWIQQMMEIQDFGELDQIVGDEKIPEDYAIFYPHLIGDKTIYADPTIRGAFVGLSLDTDRSNMIYSVMEGLCFAFRQLYEEMKLPIEHYGSVKVVGGGSKSNTWMQIMSNVLNVSVEKMGGMMGPGFGMALLAAFQDNKSKSYADIARETIKVDRCFEPDPIMVKVCEERYQKYLRIHKGLKYIMEGVSISDKNNIK